MLIAMNVMTEQELSLRLQHVTVNMQMLLLQMV